MSEWCNFRQLLGRHHLRPTALRLRVLEILGAASQALPAQKILDLIRTQRQVNKVTIYRILSGFWQYGIIRKINPEGRSTLYELACEHHPPHPHFQCLNCGEVQCLESISLDRIWDELKPVLGWRAQRLEVRVEGICPKCQALKTHSE
ncbi:MAG: transcriptional repressor [Deltaproteobacteria bacterium]|nr:transcriptional repressor [Deltaproteobacteria bacterium]